MNKDMPLQEAEEPMSSSERGSAFTGTRPQEYWFPAPAEIKPKHSFGGSLALKSIKGEVRFLHWLKPVVSANRHL